MIFCQGHYQGHPRFSMAGQDAQANVKSDVTAIGTKSKGMS